jgi:hypothetical protein
MQFFRETADRDNLTLIGNRSLVETQVKLMSVVSVCEGGINHHWVLLGVNL